MSATSVGEIGLDLVVNKKQFEKQMAGIQSIAAKVGKTLVAAFSIKKLVDFGKQCIELSSDLQEVQNVANVAFPSMTAQLDDFAKSAKESFGLSETMAKKYSSMYGTMAKQFGFTEQSAYDMGTTLAGLAGDVASFYNMTQDEAYTKLKSVFSGETETLKEIGVVMTQNALDAYALANGFGKTTEKMSEAEKVALRYAFVQNKLSAAQGDFARTSDSWANQTRLLKLNLEELGTTIGGTLINAFKPLVSTLNVVIGKFTEFAKAVSDSLGKIFGWQYEESGGGVASDLEIGAGSADDISSGIGDAANNAKKLRQQLRSFDELNVITSSSDSGSDGSSGSTGTSGGDAVSSSSGGEWIKTESLLKNYESELDSLYKLGEYIGDTITKSLNSINWDEIYQGARNFGTGLADFLNGLISPELFGAVGSTIAGALNTAIYTALSFGQRFDFYDYGVSLATGINNFFTDFDFKALAQTLNVWVDGLKETIAGFLKTLSWSDILASVGDFLGELEFDTVAVIGLLTIKKITGINIIASGLEAIGTTVSRKLAQVIASKLGIEIAANAGIGTALTTGLLTNISAAISSVGTNIGLLIEGLFSGLSWIEALKVSFPGIAAIATTVTTWVSGTLVPALTAVGAKIAAVISGPWGIAIAAAFAALLLILSNWDSVVEFAKQAWEKITEIFSKAGEWFKTNVVEPLGESFTELCENVSEFFDNLWNDITVLWDTASQWFYDNVIIPIIDFFEGLAIRVGQIFEGLWIIIQAVWIIVSNWFDKNVVTPIVTLFKNFRNSVENFFSGLWSSIKNIWANVSSWFNEKVVIPVTGFFKGIWMNVSGFFSNLWSGIKSIWNVAANWFSTTVITPLKTAFQKACDSIKAFFDRLFLGIKMGIVNAINAAIGGIETGINNIVDKINLIIKGFNKVVSWAAKVADIEWGGVSLVPTVSIPRIKTYATGGFPEDGWFRAKHGEIMGKFDNGKSVVANNTQITEGIASAVYRGNQEGNALLRQEVELLQKIIEVLLDILEKETGFSKTDIFNSVRDSANSYFKRTGSSPFPY